MMSRHSMLRHFVKTFCEWKPRIPRHKTVLEKNTYRAPHQIWDLKDAEKIEITHLPPKNTRDKLAFYLMKSLRYSFDFFTQYKPGKMNESKYLRRCIFLETIAGVPGMIGGMMRHLSSLRSLKEDGGWIHHLLEEAENERMHLLTFLNLKQPSKFERVTIIMAQFVFIIYYSGLYMVSSKLSHRFVAYLEEEAVKTYSTIIKELDEGKLPLWTNFPAPKEAIKYWDLPKDAKMREVFIAIRADEIAHREYNHHFADLKKNDLMEKEEYYIRDEKPIEWGKTDKSKSSLL